MDGYWRQQSTFWWSKGPNDVAPVAAMVLGAGIRQSVYSGGSKLVKSEVHADQMIEIWRLTFLGETNANYWAVHEAGVRHVFIAGVGCFIWLGGHGAV